MFFLTPTRLRPLAALVGCCLTAAAHAEVCANWLEHSLPANRRSSHAMVYDSARDVLVLFGGFADNPLGDTWEFHASAWHRVATTGPSPRAGHAMVFDTSRGVTVLFGGWNGTSREGDTWEWDGTTWTQKASTGPSPRFGHAMVYGAPGGPILLFGGSTVSGMSGETWAWDGQVWTLKATAGPTARTEHALAQDVGRNVAVLFGGDTANGLSAETWEWNGSVWTLRTSTGPSPRSGHAMTYQVLTPATGSGYTLLFGGSDAVNKGDSWKWNGTTWELQEVDAPTPRKEHTMAFSSQQGVIFLFGGDDGTESGDTWQWSNGRWNPISIQPSVRFDHAMVYDFVRGTTLLFGGWGGQREGDTWEWNGISWSRRFPNHNPPPLVRHAMAYDSDRGVTVLFSGYSDQGYRGETWEWNDTDWHRTALYDPSDPSFGPTPRVNHAMVYDASRHATLLYGGSRIISNSVAYNNELWSWDGYTQQWTLLTNSTGPTERHNVAMAYDSVRGVTVLFGGSNDNWGPPGPQRLSGQTWEWNGITWQLKATTGPSPRALHAMAYDPSRGKTLLFGGWDGTDKNDIWGWDGQSWSFLGETGPDVRYGHSSAYDIRRSVLVMYGGLDAAENVHGDLWEVSLMPPDLNCDGRVDDLDLALLKNCSSSSGVPPTGPNCQNADFDHDGDVDLNDFGVLQRCYSGPNTPPDPSCIN